MNYTQIYAPYVFGSISDGFNVIVCDFEQSKILYTNELTVETIRSYIAKSDVAFFKIEQAQAQA